MRRFGITVTAVALTLVAIVRGESVAKPADAVTIRVTSAQSDKPVEFAVRYFGADVQSGDARDHVTTPYDITVTGDEAYAIFRQTGGPGAMRIEVRKGNASGTTTGPVSMIVVAHEKLAVTGFQE
jgi:hypothetical protein